VFFLALNCEQLIAFGIDATRELKKVVWPTRKEATQMDAGRYLVLCWSWRFFWLTDESPEIDFLPTSFSDGEVMTANLQEVLPLHPWQAPHPRNPDFRLEWRGACVFRHGKGG
jgi:hypothetical protein